MSIQEINGAATDDADKARKAAARKEQRKLRMVEGSDGETETRPLVRIAKGEMAARVSQVEQLLISGGARIYQRGVHLVRAVEEQQKDADGKTTKIVALHQVDRIYLRNLMNRMIHFMQFDGRANDWMNADAPMEYAETMLALKGEWQFKVVAGVLNAPTLRSDGSVLSAQGYDDATGLILHSALSLPEMPDKPTREDAMAALELLKALLEDVACVPVGTETLECNAALSVALSMLITPTTRGCMDVAPAHVVTAPAAGTGKSYVANLAAAIALGERCSVMSINSNDEETEKRLGARALAGNPIISIDNVNDDLGGDVLCQLISESMVEVRVLGMSKMIKVPNRFCLFMNGNNLRLKGDLTRRTLTCRLDAGMERPSEREFHGNPLAAVMANRGKYVAACLTIVRAYFVAGRPPQEINGAPLLPMNSFEQWSRSVRSALVWLGCADPVSTVARAQDNDPERQAIAAFHEAFQADVGVGRGNALLAADMMELAANPSHANLRAAINGAPIKHGSSVSFGKWLGRIVDRQVGVCAVKALAGRANRTEYYVDVVA